MEKGFLFREVIKHLLTLVFFYFGMKYFWGTEQWFNDKVKEMLFYLSIGIIYFIASLATVIFSRPVTITIEQSNKCFGKSTTTFSIHGRKRTQEHERTVEAKLFIQRHKSIWGVLCSKLLIWYKPTVVFEPATAGLVIQAARAGARLDLTDTQYGLELDLATYLNSIIENVPQGKLSKAIDYKISDDPINPLTDETIYIVPKLLCRGKNAPHWLTTMIRFNNTKCGHTVYFKRE